jgi:hypothetical protein
MVVPATIRPRFDLRRRSTRVSRAFGTLQGAPFGSILGWIGVAQFALAVDVESR